MATISTTTFEFGDIVLVEFPLSESTQRKRRPAMVVLDIGDADVVVAPITTRKRFDQGDFHIDEWAQAGLLRDSWVRLAKISCLTKSDIARHLGRLALRDRDSLVSSWRSLYAIEI